MIFTQGIECRTSALFVIIMHCFRHDIVLRVNHPSLWIVVSASLPASVKSGAIDEELLSAGDFPSLFLVTAPQANRPALART